MKHNWPEIFGVCFVALVMAIALRGWPWSAGESGNLADWASAGATTLAAVVALWVATGEARRRRREEHDVVLVYRWIFGSELATIWAGLDEVRLVLSRIVEAGQYRGLTSEGRKYLRELAEMLYTPSVDAHIGQLTKFPTQQAQSIAAIVGHLRGLQRHLFRLSEDKHAPGLDVPAVAASLLRRLDLIDEHFRNAELSDSKGHEIPPVQP